MNDALIEIINFISNMVRADETGNKYIVAIRAGDKEDHTLNRIYQMIESINKNYICCVLKQFISIIILLFVSTASFSDSSFGSIQVAFKVINKKKQPVPNTKYLFSYGGRHKKILTDSKGQGSITCNIIFPCFSGSGSKDQKMEQMKRFNGRFYRIVSLENGGSVAKANYFEKLSFKRDELIFDTVVFEIRALTKMERTVYDSIISK